MPANSALAALSPGDRVRVLGWLDAAGRQLDVVGAVAERDARDAADTVTSRSVTLRSVGGPTADFDEALPAGVETGDRLTLYAARDADGSWTRPELWLHDPDSAGVTAAGSVQHVEVVAPGDG